MNTTSIIPLFPIFSYLVDFSGFSLAINPWLVLAGSTGAELASKEITNYNSTHTSCRWLNPGLESLDSPPVSILRVGEDYIPAFIPSLLEARLLWPQATPQATSWLKAIPQ